MYPTSVETSIHSTIEHDITIKFAQSDIIDQSPRQQLHKLHIGVPFYDIKPPPGIPKMALDHIRLAMSISPAAQQTHRHRTLKQIGHNSGSQVFHPRERCSIGFRSYLRVNGDYKIPKYPADYVVTSCDKHDTDCGDLRPEKIAVSHQTCSHCQSVSPGSKLILQRSPNVFADEIGELLDAAVRHAISSSPKRLSKGIRVVSHESFTPLADLAPSLWVPGHQRALSSRSIFVPTISHALASIGRSSTRGRGTILGLKLMELSNRAVSSVTGCEQSLATRENEKDHRTIHNGLSVKIWRSMQCQLIDHDASNRLLPLFQLSSAYQSSDGQLTTKAGLELQSNTIDQSQWVGPMDELPFDDNDFLLDACDYDTDSGDVILDSIENEYPRLSDLFDSGCNSSGASAQNNRAESDMVETDATLLLSSDDLPKMRYVANVLDGDIESFPNHMDWDLSSDALRSDGDDILHT